MPNSTNKPHKTYRVQEKHLTFTIQVLVVRTESTGILWWKKSETIRRWRNVDTFGEPIIRMYLGHGIVYDNSDNILPQYTSLKEARMIIKSFNSKPTNWYCEDIDD